MIPGMTQPLVSIIMPAYNCEQYIEIAIRSVMQQTHESWELLIIDDCSADSTYSIVQSIAQEDSRIRCTRNSTNMGVAKTRNRGLDWAQGDFVAFLDSDDLWHPEKLAVQLCHMINERADLSCTSYAIVDEKGRVSKSAYIVNGDISFRSLLNENTIGCSTVLLSSEIARKFRFVTDFYHEDYCLWLSILQDGYHAVGCSEVLTDWRLIANSRSFNKRKSAMNRWRIYRKHLRLSLPKSIRAFISYAWGGWKKYYGKS